MVKSALLAGFFLILSAISVSTQQPNRQFKICVLNTLTTECKNLDRAGSGVQCVPVVDSTDCALKIQNRTAHFGMFKAEEALLASHFLEGVSVIGDIRHEERLQAEFSFSAAAIARRARVPSGDLMLAQNLSLCHPGMGQSHSTWSDLVLKELDLTILDKKGNLRCDDWRTGLQNEIFSISEQWGPSCRPGAWSWDSEADKILKNDYPSLCAKCPDNANCGYLDPSDTHKATIECLKNGGDVAYVALERAIEFFDSTPGAYKDYAYVCKDLKLASNFSNNCLFVRQPWSSIVAAKEIADELGPKLYEWLKPLEPRLSYEQVPERADGGWQKTLIELLLENYHLYVPLRPYLDLKTFVGRGRRLKQKEDVRACDRRIRWCVGDWEERPKCGWLSTAAWYAGIVPEIKCVYGETERDCVHKVSKNEADLVVANIDNTHYGISTKKLKTTRFVETPDSDLTSVVAVVKANSGFTSLKDLKGKKACFPSYEGIGYGAFLRDGFNQSLIKQDTCPYGNSVAEYFSSSCAPGSIGNGEKPSLCALCEAKVPSDCTASPTNSFYDDVGAMRCLADSGDVAYVRLHEVLVAFQKNLIERQIMNDFKVLCNPAGKPDSTVILGPRAVECALATVPSHAVLTRKNDELNNERDASIILSSIDSLFGLEDTRVQPNKPTFYMYHTFANNPDLIFPSSSNSLMVSSSNNRNVKEFLKFIRDVPRPCGITSSAFILKSSFVPLLLTLIAFISFN